jgi:hypothetical protein
MADNLVGGIAEDPLYSRVGELNRALFVNYENRHGGVLGEGTESLLALPERCRRAPPFGHIVEIN